MTREELIQEFHDYIGNRHYSTDHIIDFVIHRERLLLEKIGKVLREYEQAGKAIECNMINMSLMINRIQEVLAIIEKESV